MSGDLVHELAHALVAKLDEQFAYDYEEVIVESATYIAGSSAGLDTSGESIPYVAKRRSHPATPRTHTCQLLMSRLIKTTDGSNTLQATGTAGNAFWVFRVDSDGAPSLR